ncbi:dUTP diphosphatase [Lysinibacillus fusiformis]|uniref:dUTP diphosphatase n=1 Tax=Lysinibacillus fusiformis TaxID=28031 RepID=UPI00148C51EA|nr:dUTP diphosphatase [Lysinibacillus fusiformis]NOG28544.1 dUTPase [Lysinibacillus fusiformis]
MNLTKLFETQATLDEHIMQEHPELRGQNNLDWKLLALQVELGECANEWRGFKKWSNDQEPRTVVYEDCKSCNAEGSISYRGNGSGEWLSCNKCEGSGAILAGNPLLEEYVDCLHFILSIGLELGANNWMKLSDYPMVNVSGDITLQFLDVHSKTLKVVEEIIRMESAPAEIRDLYTRSFESFLHLGAKLGFTWEQVEEGYYVKNMVNHARQESGY